MNANDDEWRINVTKDIMNCFSNLKDLGDLVVEINEKRILCHSFLLVACSDFFQCMFRCNMKEKESMVVKLNNVSADIFHLILDALYTGADILTHENFIEFWKAVHFFQIPFLMQQCEDYCLSQLSFANLEIYKGCAELLGSLRARAGILNFISENFSALKDTRVFLNLEVHDIMNLIKSDTLIVESEDSVLYSIINWITYGELLALSNDQNEYTQNSQEDSTAINLLSKQNFFDCRDSFFAQLLLCSRFVLASETCLLEVLQHPLVINDLNVKCILAKAYEWKINKNTRASLSSPAINRNCWGLEHVSVYCNMDVTTLEYTSLKESTISTVVGLPLNNVRILAVSRNTLYALEQFNNVFNIHKISRKDCIKLISFKRYAADNLVIMLSHENIMYILTKDRIRGFALDDELKINDLNFPIDSAMYAISCMNKILIFSSQDSGNGLMETVVHSWTPTTDDWNRINNLDFDSRNMVSFETDEEAYIIDTAGNLLKISLTNTIGFTNVGKLWNLSLSLTGVILFRNHLYVYKKCNTFAADITVDIPQGQDIFIDITFITKCKKPSNVVHMVIEKNSTNK